ncbi:hypothetical protein FrCorBMG51_18855 [Protofrankia coriariae]|uniref:Uncharacterized protein n=1 Tax=Protofrankia coriariae TaxID=1562887 RepID=A0ABR5F0W4_9ACTN|nr:hypothetical protein FrCorBMG51_18855 [Protofrankia coriariae]
MLHGEPAELVRGACHLGVLAEVDDGAQADLGEDGPAATVEPVQGARAQQRPPAHRTTVRGRIPADVPEVDRARRERDAPWFHRRGNSRGNGRGDGPGSGPGGPPCRVGQVGTVGRRGLPGHRVTAPA